MKKRALILGLTVVFMFCGCGVAFPELTDEEAAEIGEYAAITLLKYDANNRSRLVDLSLIDAPQVQEPAAEESKTEQKPEEKPPVPNTPVIDIGEDSGVKSMEEFFDFAEGMAVNYIGEETCQSYTAGDHDYFSIDASAGKKLLVLNFQISNVTGVEQSVDMLHRRDAYRITVNETYTRAPLTTMLLNDMKTYEGTIAAGDNVTVVLMIELDQEQADAISSIKLNLKNESKTYTIQLF